MVLSSHLMFVHGLCAQFKTWERIPTPSRARLLWGRAVQLKRKLCMLSAVSAAYHPLVLLS